MPESPHHTADDAASAASGSAPQSVVESVPGTPVGGSRRGLTAGTAPATGNGESTRVSDRRGVVLGLLTAGAAAVAGAAVATVRGTGAGSASSGPAVTATGRTVRATLTVSGMRFVPDTVRVSPGDHLVITLRNTAEQVHDLVLDTGATTGRVAAGGSATLDAGIVAGPVEGWCSIAGHRAQGMVLHVETGPHATVHTDHGEPADPGEVTASAVPDLQAPLPEGFQPWPAALEPAPAGTTHRLTLTVTEEEGVYVGAGVTQRRWVYNGTAPGPVLRGRVGDEFEVTLVNKGSMSHSIDFHAGIVSPDEVMRSIGPGESLTYRFTARHSGIWLYHCSTPPMSVHLASGMYGAVIIDPDGLAEADREYLLIQSETYLGPEGSETDAAKVAAKAPDLMAFNGVAFQYALAPLEARAGERVRFWVLDAGPSLPSSFHVVGLQFDTVFHEGTYLLGGPEQRGRAWHGGAQALALAPAQGGFVEAVVPAAGHYAVVTHAFADMEKGAKAVLAVTD